MKDKTTTKTFVSFDPEFIEVVGMTPAVLLGFIRFRTASKHAVMVNGKRWMRITIANVAEALHVSSRTASAAFKTLLDAGLVKSQSDGRAGSGRFIACDAQAIEAAIPGCWLASQLESDMNKPAEGILNIKPNHATSAGSTMQHLQGQPCNICRVGFRGNRHRHHL